MHSSYSETERQYAPVARSEMDAMEHRIRELEARLREVERLTKGLPVRVNTDAIGRTAYQAASEAARKLQSAGW